MLCILDEFRWVNDFPVKYFSGVATIANVWRGTGNPAKLRCQAASMWSEVVASKLFSKVPGRPLRGRWGSIDSIEGLISKGSNYIPNAFERCFGSEAVRPSSSRKRSILDDDEEDAYREKVKNYKLNATKMLSQPRFVTMVKISAVAKSVLTRCLLWGQKRVSEWNRAEQAARTEGHTFLGPTPPSMFVCGKAESLYHDIADLLNTERFSRQDVWGSIWPSVCETDRIEANALIAHLVLQCACSWQYRMMRPTQSFPLLMMRMVESDANTICEIRRNVARRLLGTDECCQTTSESDLTLKVKRFSSTKYALSGTLADVVLNSSRGCLRGDPSCPSTRRKSKGLIL